MFLLQYAMCFLPQLLFATNPQGQSWTADALSFFGPRLVSEIQMPSIFPCYPPKWFQVFVTPHRKFETSDVLTI